YPAAYENQSAFDFIKVVPTTWDETRVLNGLPGEYITIARRNGDQWFVGAMSNWNPSELELPLTFLGSGRLTAQIYSDAPDSDRYPKQVRIETRRVNSATRLKIQLASGGGCAIQIQPTR